jgi:hypothetical protein
LSKNRTSERVKISCGDDVNVGDRCVRFGGASVPAASGVVSFSMAVGTQDQARLLAFDVRARSGLRPG